MDREYSSFRDPSGAVFYREGDVYRWVHECYREQYELLMGSGLYRALAEAGLLVSHEEVAMRPAPEEAFACLKPERIEFISYPYEWCFGQLRDAALATLRIHRRALDAGMILKDASAYNIQFRRGRAVLIDTLSFELYRDGMPWVAYGQFCRHFLAPLMLMAHVDVRLGQLMRTYIDGVPLDLASRLLRRGGGFAAMQHIHWHARATVRHGEDGKRVDAARIARVSRFSHAAMIDSLIRTVEGLRLRGISTEWGDYYAHTNYVDEAGQSKEALVGALLDQIEPRTAWDFGANDGRYTRLALARGGSAVAFDIDPIAVERNHAAVAASGERMLPLLLDLTNPSPAIGFANRERLGIADRGRPDVILMLAVIHHLAISNNLPLARIAEWLASLSGQLIIEFVPKSDSQVQTLLSTRADIFPGYTREGFEREFGQWFDIARAEPIEHSERTLYWMRAKT